jgi:kinetochore protein Mis13/DSN1
MPHESVPPERFYRHIDADLPEPVRARHLLVWCARRAAVRKPVDAKGKGTSKLNSQDQALVASIQDRVLKQLMDLRIDIPLYETGKEKKQANQRLEDDPANIRNREAKERLTKAEERYAFHTIHIINLPIFASASQEDALWSKVIQEYNAMQSNVLSSLPPEPPQPTSGLPDVRLSELDEKWQKVDDELEFYRLECERGSELDAQIANRVRMLPVQVR